MTDIQGHNVTPAGRAMPAAQGAARRPGKTAAGAKDAAAAQPEQQDLRRAVLAAVSARAATAQRCALAAKTAIEVLSQVEGAVAFALDAASEASSMRTLPDEAVNLLQWQVDTAVSAVDSLCGGAACGGERLFDGRFTLRGGGGEFKLPEVSSRSLGGASRAEIRMWGDGVEYSQSIASAATGGPNGLSYFAGGAAQAFSTGLAKVREIREGVARFYDERVVPALSDAAVALANVLAVETHPPDVAEVARLFDGLRGDPAAARETAAAPQAGAVLRLLQ